MDEKPAQFKIKWIDAHREPKVAPDPRYAEGLDLDIAGGITPACTAALPYPAKRIGYYIVTCTLCRRTVAITTAGRPDDPRSVKIPCRTENPEH